MQPLIIQNRRQTARRRMGLTLLVAATVLAISWQMFSLLRINILTPLKFAIFFLSLALLIPLSLSFWTAIIGFWLSLRGGDPLKRANSPEAIDPADLPRTAIIIPAYNEEPIRLFAGLKATYEDLRQTGSLPHFDFFILSDTTDPDIWVQEEMAFAEFRANAADPDRLSYRNRRDNVDRKVGNIAEFCLTWGERYRYMIVLDADSVMTGESLISLLQLMEQNPEAGIVQAPPLPVNRRTLFGRLHQFAAHAYNSMFIAGLNFWQAGAANYWGHNAIIRIAPFVEHCRLPRLSGREPMGGSILSHDFVEAALMRRAGWKVYLAGELRGSYEEVPSSLIGYVARDRRWCQGNLQHIRLLFTPGFHLVSRVHLCNGVMAYLSSPLWILLLLLSTAECLREALSKHVYFSPGRSLFPIWKISVERQALVLFSTMMALLFAPKFLSLVAHLLDRGRRAALGGGINLTRSVIVETFLATLEAPVLALLQSHFVLATLAGKSVTWESQDRDEAATRFSEALRRHWFGTFLAIAWTALLVWTAPKLLWWFFPFLAGLMLAIPLSVWSSRIDAGIWAKNHGLLLTPEEVDPPPILQCLGQERDAAATRPWAERRDGLMRVLTDPQVLDLHLACLNHSGPEDSLQQHYLKGLELKFRRGGADALTAREKRELLLSSDSILALKAEAPASQPVS